MSFTLPHVMTPTREKVMTLYYCRFLSAGSPQKEVVEEHFEADRDIEARGIAHGMLVKRTDLLGFDLWTGYQCIETYRRN
jgi:hypothetical protein